VQNFDKIQKKFARGRYEGYSSSILAVLLNHNFYIKTILLSNNFYGKNCLLLLVLIY